MPSKAAAPGTIETSIASAVVAAKVLLSMLPEACCHKTSLIIGNMEIQMLVHQYFQPYLHMWQLGVQENCGVGSGLMVTLDAIIILFIPKTCYGYFSCRNEYSENYWRSNRTHNIGCHNTVDGEEQLFPGPVAFDLIFFICLILGVVLTIAVVLLRNREVKVILASSSTVLK